MTYFSRCVLAVACAQAVALNAARASQDHANAVETLLADSIEVLRGPSTLLYGGGAIGGVEYRHDTASDMDVVVGRFEAASGPFAFHVDGM